MLSVILVLLCLSAPLRRDHWQWLLADNHSTGSCVITLGHCMIVSLNTHTGLVPLLCLANCSGDINSLRVKIAQVGHTTILGAHAAARYTMCPLVSVWLCHDHY